MVGNQRIDCLGCRLANNQEKSHVIFEDLFVTCLLDHKPFNEGHLLILPKTHIVEIDEFDTEHMLSVMNAAKLMTKAVKTLFVPDGVTLSQNGGMFNELTHFHMHIVPRYQEECFGDFYTQIPQFAEKDDALAATVQKMRRVIQQMSL
ncbi:HIT family protein [Priestia megaterium]|uniref:HIT family protein n=1 Tax=Priestia megaterium TaxID=1404 RepID=UPI00244664E0|nr:HIT family protein [Priestia megaterium]WRQ95418.1 HIT family protein [Priestia megaterium]